MLDPPGAGSGALSSVYSGAPVDCLLLRLPVELQSLIFKQPILHQFDRILFGRTCRELHRVQRDTYKFPAGPGCTLLKKDDFFVSICTYIRDLSEEMYDQPIQAYGQVMSTYLKPLRELFVRNSWVMRMIQSTPLSFLTLMRKAACRHGPKIYAITFILHNFSVVHKGYLELFIVLLRPGVGTIPLKTIKCAFRRAIGTITFADAQRIVNYARRQKRSDVVQYIQGVRS